LLAKVVDHLCVIYLLDDVEIVGGRVDVIVKVTDYDVSAQRNVISLRGASDY
jgi:hypothetical protein